MILLEMTGKYKGNTESNEMLKGASISLENMNAFHR